MTDLMTNVRKFSQIGAIVAASFLAGCGDGKKESSYLPPGINQSAFSADGIGLHMNKLAEENHSYVKNTSPGWKKVNIGKEYASELADYFGLPDDAGFGEAGSIEMGYPTRSINGFPESDAGFAVNLRFSSINSEAIFNVGQNMKECLGEPDEHINSETRLLYKWNNRKNEYIKLEVDARSLEYIVKLKKIK